MSLIRVGTRKSPLAMAQAEWAANLIRKNKKFSAGKEVKLTGIVTEGDEVARALKGGKGIFVKALDDALLKNKIDVAVHSAKDVPTRLTNGLAITAILAREDVADLLISREGWTLDTIPEGCRVGTSSLRRSAQILFYRPDINIVPVRGNVGTRLSKTLGGKDGCDAVVIAAAGVNRLGGVAMVVESMGLKSHRLDPSLFLPAPAQAALMMVVRTEDEDRFSFLSDGPTLTAVRMERELVASLGADCGWPLGALAMSISPALWSLEAAIFSVDGKMRVRDRVTGQAPTDMAGDLAGRLLAKGGKKILEWNRERE